MGHGGARGQRGWAPGAERVTVSLRPGQQLCKRSPRFSLLQGSCGAGAYRASFLVGPSHCHPNPAPSRALLSFGASGCRPGPQTPVCGKRGRGLGLGGRGRSWGGARITALCAWPSPRPGPSLALCCHLVARRGRAAWASPAGQQVHRAPGRRLLGAGRARTSGFRGGSGEGGMTRKLPAPQRPVTPRLPCPDRERGL